AKPGVASVAFGPDGKTLVTGGWDKLVRLWDIRTGAELRAFPSREQPVRQVAVSPDGRRIASVGYHLGNDGGVRGWDAASGKVVREVEGVADARGGMAFSPDGRFLALASGLDAVRLFEVESGRLVRSMGASPRQEYPLPVPLAYSPDGRTIAVGSLLDGTI